VAKGAGRTASQVALAWVRQQPFGVIVPILGAKTVAQLRDNLGCLDFTLGPDQLARLDAASRIDPSVFLGPWRPISWAMTPGSTKPMP